MNKKVASSLLMLALLLGGCAADVVVPPCSQSLAARTLGPQCSHPDEQPAVSPVGSWAGTLSMSTGGSGTQTFTAVVALEADGGDFTGVFAVASESFDVRGYRYTDEAGDVQIVFQSPGAVLIPQVTPALFTGLTWAGALSTTIFSGTWTQQEESAERARGTFTLERLP